MKHPAPPFFSLLIVLSLLACQFVSDLPIPGGSVSSGGADTAGICSIQPDLGFDIEGASTMPTCSEGCTEIVPEVGREAAEALAAELTPKDTLCELGISAETQAVIDRARVLAQDGETEQALGLLAERMAELGRHASLGGRLAFPSSLSEGADQAVWDLYSMGGAAADLGGDEVPFWNAANSVFRDYAAQELPDADLQETLEIEMEAQKLGENDIAEQAHKRRQELAEEEFKEEAAYVDPCTITPEELRAKLKWAMTAAVYDVSWTQLKNDNWVNFLESIQRAASVIRNRENGTTVDGCDIKGEIEIAYTQKPVAGQTEPIVIKTVVPFALDFQQEPAGSSAEATLFNDQVYNYPNMTVHNLVDFTLTVNVWLMGGETTPLEVDLIIKGKSSMTMGQLPLWSSPDYDETVPLYFPLEDGAVQEFDREGWKDFKEWRVTLHLTPGE